MAISSTNYAVSNIYFDGAATIASVLGIQIIEPPAGWGFCVMNTITGEVRRLT